MLCHDVFDWICMLVFLLRLLGYILGYRSYRTVGTKVGL